MMIIDHFVKQAFVVAERKWCTATAKSTNVPTKMAKIYALPTNMDELYAPPTNMDEFYAPPTKMAESHMLPTKVNLVSLTLIDMVQS